MSVIVDIISSLFKLAVYWFGNEILSRWVAAARFWLRTRASREFLLLVDESYRQLLMDWEKLKKDRE